MKNFIKNKTCLTTKLEGRMIILDTETGIYFETNETGTLIWDLLSRFKSREKIIEKIMMEFNTPEDVIIRDVDNFLSICIKKGLISVE
tara:strand:- start:237 stop:500 length:264 start_codon:yes stop_codon:yes gene_type:complete